MVLPSLYNCLNTFKRNIHLIKCSLQSILSDLEAKFLLNSVTPVSKRIECIGLKTVLDILSDFCWNWPRSASWTDSLLCAITPHMKILHHHNTGRSFDSSNIANFFPSKAHLSAVDVCIPELDDQESMPFGIRPFNSFHLGNILLLLPLFLGFGKEALQFCQLWQSNVLIKLGH